MFIVHISNINSPDTLVSLGIRERSQNERLIVQEFEADLLKISDFSQYLFLWNITEKEFPEFWLEWGKQCLQHAVQTRYFQISLQFCLLPGNKMNLSIELGILLVVRDLSYVEIPLTIIPLYQLVLLLLYHYLYSSVLMEQPELSSDYVKHVW